MHKPGTDSTKFSKRVIERLEQCLVSLKALYEERLLEVCVFGSHAKGHPRKYSSIDLLIVVSKTNERFLKRTADVERIINEDGELPQFEALTYTQDEITDLIHKKESYILSMLKESVVVWNGFNEINISKITDRNQIPSRYSAALPRLEEIEC